MNEDDLNDMEPVASDMSMSVPHRPQKSRNVSDEFSREAKTVVLPPRMRKSLTLSSLYSPTSKDSYMEQCFDDVKYLSEGTFGVVFKARSKDDGKLYAIKQFKRRFGSQKQRYLRLEEIHRYASISTSQFCVKLIRAWEENAFLYVQMELCSCTLKQFMSKNDVLDDTLWKILLDLLLALYHLHSRKFIHLDIKPDNILVSNNNIFKLSDFDLMLDLSKGPVTDAEEGDSRYLAPEVLRGVFTEAADIFSLGITIFEVGSCMQLPTHGHYWQELRHGILPYCRFSSQSKEIFEVISTMMLPVPEDRPSAVKLLKHKKLSTMCRSTRVQIFFHEMAMKMKSFCSYSKIVAINCGVRVLKPIVSWCPIFWETTPEKKKPVEKGSELENTGCPSAEHCSLQRDLGLPSTPGGQQERSEKEVKLFHNRLASCRKRLNFDDETNNNAETNRLATPNRPDGESHDGAVGELPSPKKRRLFN